MPIAGRTARSAIALVIAIVTIPALKANFCLGEPGWSLSKIADAPVLLVARVVSLDRENGPHLTGDPRSLAPEQKMTAAVKVLRSFPQPIASGPIPPDQLKIRFIGRDGPNFVSCMPDLPDLEPGQVLLLPLAKQPKESSQPWELAGVSGSGMTTRVAENLRVPATVANDARSFIVRELVNSLSGGDPTARFTAAVLANREAAYLEPDLTNQLQRSLGADASRWARLLASLLLQSPSLNPTIPELSAASPLARLALTRLPNETEAETLVWQSLLDDLLGFADEPYHPLFSYNESFALQAAVRYLSKYSDAPGLADKVKAALREDRAGSSALAAALIEQGNQSLLPDALARAFKVVARPAAENSDVFSAIMLILDKGSDEQRRQYAALASQVKAGNPDYAAMLEMTLRQRRHPGVPVAIQR